MEPGRRVVLSIGTSHPWNIAGIGLDCAIGALRGIRVVTALAAISAQDAAGLHAFEAVESSLFAAQLDAIPWQLVDGVRVGALGSASNVREVARRLREHPDIPAVVDPVFAASLGGSLANGATAGALRDDLATISSVILTPNLGEAARLLGCVAIDAAAMEEAATMLVARGPRAVLLKGGHLREDPVDLLAYAGKVEVFAASRLPGEMRGTGCVLAMALCCELARGESLVAAVVTARSFVRAQIANAVSFGGLTVTDCESGEHDDRK